VTEWPASAGHSFVGHSTRVLNVRQRDQEGGKTRRFEEPQRAVSVCLQGLVNANAPTRYWFGTRVECRLTGGGGVPRDGRAPGDKKRCCVRLDLVCFGRRRSLCARRQRTELSLVQGRDAATGGADQGRWSSKEVTFEPVDGRINDRIDEAYRAKYRGGPYLSPLIGPRAARGFRLVVRALLSIAHSRETVGEAYKTAPTVVGS